MTREELEYINNLKELKKSIIKCIHLYIDLKNEMSIICIFLKHLFWKLPYEYID